MTTAGGLQSYDASEDAWTRHQAPTALPDYVELVAAHGRVIVIRGERGRNDPPDTVYDPATETWSLLPLDPLGPAFDRTLTSTSHGLVLTGHDMLPQPGSQSPSYLRAALLPRGSERRQLLPDSHQLGGWRWTWTGGRMVDPTLGGADGGDTNGYGRTNGYGGVLEPASGEWGRLPNPPAEFTGGWGVEAITGPFAAIEGWVYDDVDQTWTNLPRPDGAPDQPGSAVWAGDRLIVVGAWILTMATRSSRCPTARGPTSICPDVSGPLQFAARCRCRIGAGLRRRRRRPVRSRRLAAAHSRTCAHW